jgi:hypothetical protein
MAKEISLTRGYTTIVDDDSYGELARHKWHINGAGYAVRFIGGRINKKALLMHRFIIDAPQGMLVDHINGNKLDNRRSNLRICTQAQNQMNVGKHRDNSSGYKGVSLSKRVGKWRADIKANGKRRTIGYFDTAERAAFAYNEAAKKYHGEFSKINSSVNQ